MTGHAGWRTSCCPATPAIDSDGTYEQRAPRPARARLARPARRGARRLPHRPGAGSSAGRPLGAMPPLRTSGTRSAGPRSAHVRWHELRPPDRPPGSAVAVSWTKPTRAARCCTPVSGRPTRRAAWSPSCRRPTTRSRTPLDDDYPFVLTTGRRLEFFNTGVQTRAPVGSPPGRAGVMIHPDDAASYGIERAIWCGCDRGVARSRCGPALTPGSRAGYCS